MTRRLLLPALLLLLAAACAKGPSSVPRLVREDASLITREQVLAAQSATAYELVQSLRPQWLRKRGAHSVHDPQDDVIVYLGNVRLGGIPALRQVASSNIGLLRFYDPAKANYRFGPGHTHGVIQVLLEGGQ